MCVGDSSGGEVEAIISAWVTISINGGAKPQEGDRRGKGREGEVRLLLSGKL